MQLIIQIFPAQDGTLDRRADLRAEVEQRHLALTHCSGRVGDTYTLDLDHCYPLLQTLHDFGFAPTAFRVLLAHAAGRPRKGTSRALTRRFAAISNALLTLNDLAQLGHFASAESDLRLILEALLLLLRTTQQEIEALESEEARGLLAENQRGGSGGNEP